MNHPDWYKPTEKALHWGEASNPKRGIETSKGNFAKKCVMRHIEKI